ncbi:MAG: hypothetical protein ACJ786_31725 [Catenulispora sp.]
MRTTLTHKALRKLREAGVITVGYGRFRVYDLEGLRRIAYP